MDYNILSVEDNSLEMCQCAGKHVPKPMMLAVVETRGGRVNLCPTSLMNLRQLLWELDLTDGYPLGSITKHYGKYLRDLADQIYEGSDADVHSDRR